MRVDAERGAAGILEQIEQVGRGLIAAHRVQAIGIGFGGPVDQAAGRVIASHQIAGWGNFPLREWCRERFGLPVVLGNDCDLAAIAEAKFGAGRDKQTVFYVTVGTGIGGGLVIDGRLHGTGRPAAAEIGHLRPCGFDADNAAVTVESIASGPGIESAVRDALRNAERPRSPAAVELLDSCGGEVDRLAAEKIAETARRGNSIAAGAIERSVECLGWAVAQVVTLLAPDVVVVGGGVFADGRGVVLRAAADGGGAARLRTAGGVVRDSAG